MNGDARALLQVGSGFHPDFTGRENVYGYLAYLGITGKEADKRFSEIVDFAELEEYIEQPLKTYSTGMAVRLMFSTSTSVAPDILVLDEVLSVGDAYFSHKSFDRIKELSERNGTTLLLVSHDVYSAAKLCPRMIWLDRGHVLIDGASSTVITAYEDSIREQEEQRLRKRKQNRLDELARAASDNRTHVMLEIRSRNNQPQPSSVYFSRIELRSSGKSQPRYRSRAMKTDRVHTFKSRDVTGENRPFGTGAQPGRCVTLALHFIKSPEFSASKISTSRPPRLNWWSSTEPRVHATF